LVWVIVGTWEPKPGADPEVVVSAEPAQFPWAMTILIGAVTIALSIIYYVQAVQLGRIFGELGVKSPQLIGVIVTAASSGVVLGGLFYRKLSHRPISQLFAIILLAFAIGYLGIAISPDYRVGLPFAIVAQFANGLVLPTLISWALSKYDYVNRGRGMGVWGSCFFIGTFLSPPLLSLVGVWAGTFLKSVGAIGGACLAVSVLLWIVTASRRAPPVLVSS
jgi:predicted MFS family arabinose efflux permease